MHSTFGERRPPAGEDGPGLARFQTARSSLVLATTMLLGSRPRAAVANGMKGPFPRLPFDLFAAVTGLSPARNAPRRLACP